jgi:tetratricopeptide (TPR) repeat protein
MAELSGEAAQRGISVALDKSYLRVEPEESYYVVIAFRAPPSVAEDSYDAELRVKGNYTYITREGVYPLLKEFYITVNVDHPPATLAATWDLAEWGKLRAGQTFERTLTVRETFGYAGASNVSLHLSKTGPVNLSYTTEVGDVLAGGSKEIKVRIQVPERRLRPGDYWVAPRIVKDYNVQVAVLERANYTIPRPEMALSSTKIDFGKLTFEVGRDSAKASITISETGGYTPIEGLSVSRTKGEEGWIAHSQVDYIPPGGNATLNFTLLLPPDASLGKKSWTFALTTKYAGSVNIAAEAMVYFPGLEEAERHLAQLSDSPYQGVVQNLRGLITASKDITELREIAMVMSVYSGVVSFISVFSDINTRSQEERIEAVILARGSLNRAKIGSENLEDKKLRKYAIPAVEALEEVWVREALEVVEALEGRLVGEERDYRSATLDYRRLKILYSLMGDRERAKEYSSKQEEMERAYYRALREAASLLKSSEAEVAAARGLSLNIKEASFVVNPFHYEEVISHYERAISLAERAKLMLERAGEEEQAELVAARVEELALGKRTVERAFTAYLALLTAFFLWFVARVTLGLIRWLRDSEALREGDVVLGAEG